MKSSNIGGQAVLEGIMMKNRETYSVAVRKPDGEIEVDIQEYKGVLPWKAPQKIPFIRGIIEKHTSSHLVMTVLEGVIRVAIFLIYIVLISRTKDIKRTFMYHGAEHKCINCI